MKDNPQTNGVTKFAISGTYLDMFKSYKNYIESLNFVQDTKEWRCKNIKGFLLYLQMHKIKIENLTLENIYSYMNNISNLSSRTKENRSYCLRWFLNYLYNNKSIKISGTIAFPKIKSTKGSSIPSVYTIKERNMLINSVDINSINGKRDYVIILLFALHGPRLYDVYNLKLDNIKWNENKIVFIQHKTNIIQIIYLHNELRYALLDYIKNERPKNDNNSLFLDINGNTLKYKKIQKIFYYYMKKSGININGRKHGPHSMRHSIASSEINQGTDIYKVAELLGHSNINDTKAYAKVSLEILKKLSLEVPTWKD